MKMAIPKSVRDYAIKYLFNVTQHDSDKRNSYFYTIRGYSGTYATAKGVIAAMKRIVKSERRTAK